MSTIILGHKENSFIAKKIFSISAKVTRICIVEVIEFHHRKTYNFQPNNTECKGLQVLIGFLQVILFHVIEI